MRSRSPGTEAVESLAEVLVTGDRDFLDITDQLPVQALSPRQLWEKLQEGGGPGAS